MALAFATSAKAQLAGEFATSLTIDTEYVQGADQATDIAFADDGRAVVTRKGGQITIRRDNGTLTQVSNPFPGTIDTESEKGLLGVVADPRGGNAFFFYVSNGPTDADKHRVYRAVLTENDTFEVDETPIIAASRGLGPGLEGPQNHDGGALSVYNDQLYVGVGDTGANATPPTNKYGSCLNKPNGKILRVNLDGTIPSDNPLVGTASVTSCETPNGSWGTAAPDERIFAWGFRNPFRMWVDPQTGLAWVGDVGEASEEEISVIAAGDHAGFPFFEGTDDHGRDNLQGMNCTSMQPSTPCTAPAYAYTWMGLGTAVTGGLIVEGCGWSNVFSMPHYLFADSGNDFIQALPVNEDRTGVSSMSPVEIATYNNQRPVSFRMGPDESLYVVMFGAGAVYRFSPADRTGDDCDPGTGGMGGGGGAAGQAGSGGGGQPSTGGTPGSGGSTPGGGGGSTPGTGGSTPGAGGSTPGTGGSVATGGATSGTGGVGATAGSSGSGGSDDEGCGCRVAGVPASSGALWLGVLAGAGALARRRRRRAA